MTIQEQIIAEAEKRYPELNRLSNDVVLVKKGRQDWIDGANFAMTLIPQSSGLVNNEHLPYLKSLNPQPDQQAILIYGSKYKLWRDGQYLGIAVWEKDENIGDSFQVYNGEYVNVFIADKWELVI